MAHVHDTITERPMHAESQACVNTVLLLLLLPPRPQLLLLTSMRRYQNQTTADCCASMSLGEKERWVLGNDSDHCGLNPQISNSSVLGYPNYTSTTCQISHAPSPRSAALMEPPKTAMHGSVS